VEVPANSQRIVEVELRADGSPAIEDVKPLVLDWTASHRLSGDDPDVQVEGKHRIVIDTAANDWPPPRRRVVLEQFRALLAPEWSFLGPGGSFDSAGRFVLSDDPQAPDVDAVQYKYTDGKGIYTTTPVFHLPVAGLYRDIPPDSFQADLSIKDIRWSGDTGVFRWEFWDAPDDIYNYGPSYLRGIVLEAYENSGKYYLRVRTIERLNIDERRRAGGFYTDTTGVDLATVQLQQAPASLKLRALWRESSRTWKFSYGVGGSDAMTPFKDGEFAQEVQPSANGKRNVIYIRKARQNGGFSVSLDRYQLLHRY
jgi:hypothetical protein